jgi:release factor glutamine methyltransferase
MIYEPEEDSFLLAKYVKKFSKGKILDLGTGSGIQAKTALKNTKDVLAIDIDKESVDYVRKKGIKAKISDLFSNIKGKFDLIIFNPPYLPEERLESKESKRITTGGKQGHEILERFFSNVNEHLNKNGKILIVFSSLTNKNKVDKIIKENNFNFKLLESKRLFFEELYCYLIYR